VGHEFHLTAETTVELAVRQSRPTGLKGEFIAQPLKTTDLRRGEYATVTVEREGGKTVVTKVEIVRPGAQMAGHAGTQAWGRRAEDRRGSRRPAARRIAAGGTRQ
jgi:hypothetical protein